MAYRIFKRCYTNPGEPVRDGWVRENNKILTFPTRFEAEKFITELESRDYHHFPGEYSKPDYLIRPADIKDHSKVFHR